jgi:hypothetical protein
MKRTALSVAKPDDDRPGFILYQGEAGDFRIRVRLEGTTVWLTQAQMADLFQTSVANISTHIKGILRDGELVKAATIKESLIVQNETGRQVQRKVFIYNLEMILAVGYRVKSPRGTQFRQWATSILAEYAAKGFALDDERLKNPPMLDSGLGDPFNELLERIRDIRASEKRMYLRVREIFALAVDYAPKDEHCLQFFKIIQNKLHFAATGMTAAELIADRADRNRPNMGLTTWKSGRVHKSDVTVAKNYLREGEIQELNRIVSMWLDFAEDQARRKKQVFLKDWETKLDEFLRFNERRVLPDAGKVSKERADAKAAEEYEAFAARRREALEDEGQAASIAALEEAAKRLPQKGSKGRGQ